MQTEPSTDTQKLLGPTIASYGPRKRRWREAWVWPLPGFLITLVLIVTGLDWYYYGYTQYGPIAAQSWSQDWLFWGIFAGIISILTISWQVLLDRVRVNLYRYGIEVRLPHQQYHSFRWEDMSGIAAGTIQYSMWGRTFRTHHRLTIYAMQGRRFTLDDRLSNLLELTTRLKANIYPRMLPGLRIRFQSGQQLTFGPITIHSKSMTIRGRQLSWEQVRRMTILNGHLIVETSNPGSEHLHTIHIPAHEIMNLELLLQILQRGLNEQP